MSNHTYLVLGAGLMGRAIALDLVRADDTEKVILADIDGEKAKRVASSLPFGKSVGMRLDASSFAESVAAMKQVGCTIGATSYTMNERLTRAAIEARSCFLDLGGNTSVVEAQKQLDEAARKADVLIVPNCGLAPGMALVLAAGGAREFSSLDSILIRVGGLPRHPRPPLNYQKVFSIEGLINEYSGEAIVITDGTLSSAPALSGLEELSFPPPFDTLEAFHTSGGSSLLPGMFQGKLRELNYKTIRYPGHCDLMRTLFEVGFASLDPVQLGSAVFTEREIFSELLERKLPHRGPDVVLVRVDILGSKEDLKSHLQFQIVDFGEESDNISGMMRTTAYPTSLIAQMISRSIIESRGVSTPEECVPLGPFLQGLADRGIDVQRSDTTPG